MGNRKQVHYVLLKKGEERKRLITGKGFRVSEKTMGSFAGIEVENRSAFTFDDKNKTMNSFIKAVSGYDYSDAVIMADDDMAQYFEMEDILFQARKQEFLDNLKYIISSLCNSSSAGQKPCSENGEKATVVIDSKNWSTREIFLILTMVKNYYREINVVLNHKENPGMTRIKEVMYDEWGVVVNIYEKGKKPADIQDIVLFLVEQLDKRLTQGLSWHAAYLVAEKENGKRSISLQGGEGIIYSGLVYKIKEIEPYYLMVNMAWQKPLVFKNFNVSVVDIYSYE